MTEVVRSILDAVADRVLAYRPKGEPLPPPATAKRCTSCGAKPGYACSPDCPEQRG